MKSKQRDFRKLELKRPMLGSMWASFRARVTIALLVIALASLYSPFAAILLLSLFFAYGYFARKFSSTLVDSKFLLLVVAAFSYVATLGLLIIICSAVSNISLHLVLCLEMLIFGCLYAFEVNAGHDLQQPPRRILLPADAVSAGIAVAVFVLMAIVPLLNLNIQKQHSSVLALLTGNVDNGTHLAIFNDYLDFRTVRIWGTPHPARNSIGGFYPSSWHAANAAITNVLAPSLRPGPLSAAVLGFISVLWLSVLMYLSTRLAFSLYELYTDHKNTPLPVYMVMASLALVVFYLFPAELILSGFFTFTPQLIAALILVYCLYQLLDEGVGTRSGLGLAFLYCSVSLAAWVLLLPATIGAVILGLVMTGVSRHPGRTEVLAELHASWPMASLAGASAVAQLWIMHAVKSAGSVSLGKGLLLDGGTPIYTPEIYGLLFAGLISAILYSANQKRVRFKLYEPVLAMIVATTVFSGALFIFQIYYTGTTHYYYYKCLLLVPAVLAPLGTSMIGVLIYKIRDRTLSLMVAVLIPVCITQFMPSDTHVAAFIQGSRDVSASVMQEMWQEMHATAYTKKTVTIYLIATPETSEMATLLVQANMPDNACFTALNNATMSRTMNESIEHFTNSPLPHSCSNYKVIFNVDQARASVASKRDDGKYTLKVIPS